MVLLNKWVIRILKFPMILITAQELVSALRARVMHQTARGVTFGIEVDTDPALLLLSLPRSLAPRRRS